MIVLVMAIHLCLLNIIYFGLGTVIEEGYQSQFVDYVRADAFNFAANMSGHKNLSESINTPAIEEAVLSGRTVFLRVLDKDDNIVKSFGEISKDYHFVEDYKFGHSQLDIYNIAAPLNNQDGEYFGQLQIGYDESGTREQIELAYQRCLLFSMIYTVCAFVITIYFGQRMTRPIQALQRLTRSIAHGQYQTEISVNTNVKEIKSLADTVEFMREELVSQTDSMEHLALHDNLTGLPNRVLLQDRVNQTITCRLRGAESCVLA
ncbi:hypothetical protein JYU12_02610, partial [bacterium AH-315-K03]|nr:hypothetical protein [bacterium AH-315-K03]